MKKLLLIGLLLLCNIAFGQFELETTYPDGTFNQITSMNFRSNGNVIITEKNGIITELEYTSDGIVEIELADLTDRVFSAFNEQGLQDVTLTDNPNVLIVSYSARLSYLYPNETDDFTGSFSITSRYNTSTGQEVILNRVPIIAGNHDGKATTIGNDGMLYIACGDGASGGFLQSMIDRGYILAGSITTNRLRALQVETMLGKTLRIDPMTGLGLPDNPYYTGNGSDPASKVWTVGHRNPAFATYDEETGAFILGNTLGYLPQSIERVDRGGVGFGYPYVEGFGNGNAGADQIYPGTDDTLYSELYLGVSDDWDVSLDPDVGRWQAKRCLLSYDRNLDGTEVRFKDYDVPFPYFSVPDVNFNGQFGGGLGFIRGTMYGTDLDDALLIGDFSNNNLLAVRFDPNNPERPISGSLIYVEQFQPTDIQQHPITGEIWISFYGGEIKKLISPTLNIPPVNTTKLTMKYIVNTSYFQVLGETDIYSINGQKILTLKESGYHYLDKGVYFMMYNNNVKKFVVK